jgi:protein TonB
MILNPDWIGKPTAAQANNAFPARAIRMGVSGRAELVCTVQVTGSVAGCTVASETGSYGFGAAALSLAPYFRMKPRTVDGEPVEGAKVRIPVDFNSG